MPDPLQSFAQKVSDWLLNHSKTLRDDEAKRQAYIAEHGEPPKGPKDWVAENVVQPGGDRIYNTFAGEGAAQAQREKNAERAELMRQERELHPDWYQEGLAQGTYVRKDPQEIRRIQLDQAIAQLKRAQEIQAAKEKAARPEQTMEYVPRKDR